MKDIGCCRFSFNVSKMGKKCFEHLFRTDEYDHDDALKIEAELRAAFPESSGYKITAKAIPMFRYNAPTMADLKG